MALNVTLQLEDSIVVASINNQTGKWEGTITDRMTQTCKNFDGWSGPQMASLSALSICGGALPPNIVDKMYAVAEPLLEGWPKELRPFP